MLALPLMQKEGIASMSSSDGSGGCRVRLEVAVSGFEHFLATGKGVAVATRECYVRHVLTFLTEASDPARMVDLGGVPARWVRSYVTNLGGRYAPESLKLIATAIRSFLRYGAPDTPRAPSMLFDPHSGQAWG
jgi:hypothetical protein